MKKNLTLIIIIILVVISGFSISRYFYLQKANLELQSVIKENKARIDDLVSQLMAQKELSSQLAQEKAGLSRELKALSGQFKQAEQEFSQAKESLSALQAKINLLKKENEYLSKLKTTFDEKLELANKEKEGMAAKLNSIDELKKAIADLKAKMRRERIKAKSPDPIARDIEGNRGYLTWKGQPTLKNKVKIEVVPAT